MSISYVRTPTEWSRPPRAMTRPSPSYALGRWQRRKQVNRREASRPAGRDLGGARDCHTADRQYWQAHTRAHARERFDAGRRMAFALGHRRKHCPENQVIAPTCAFNRLRLVCRVHRAPDEKSVRRDRPHSSRRRRCRAQMHAVGARGERDVRPPVDDNAARAARPSRRRSVVSDRGAVHPRDRAP